MPWYLERRNVDVEKESGNDGSDRVQKDEGRNYGKKTIEELRDERLKRERQEKERTRALLIEKIKTDKVVKNRCGLIQ